MVRKLPILVAVTAALALGIAACGDDESDETTAASETTTEATTSEETTASGGGGSGEGGETVSLTESDFKIDPADVSVAAGSVTFAISNEGEAPHNIEIEGNGVEELSETFEPGASGEFTVDLEPGTYEMYCAISGHKDLGMEGEVTVE